MSNTFVSLTAIQTLTNKTLTSPTTNGTPTGTGIQTGTVKTGSKGGDYSRTSSTLANVDGTNLKYTVTIPTGWKLLVWASGTVKVATAITFGDLAITDSIGGVIDREQTNIATGGNYYPFSLLGEIDGDGSAHDVTLQFASSDNATAVSIANSANTYPKMLFLLTPSN